MPLPTDDKLADALLCYLYLYGGPTHSLFPRQVYDPLADLFAVNERERRAPRTDGRYGLMWANRVQWARQCLVNRGDLDGQVQGVWQLTSQGVNKATRSQGVAGTTGFHCVPSISVAHECIPRTASALIEETKYSLAEVIAKQRASPTAVALLDQLVKGIDAALRATGKEVVFRMRTQIYGVTGFCGDRKAFMFVNLRQDYITALYYTGRAAIPGLEKANWLNGGDNAGSETLRITDGNGIRKAVEFACAAHAIASKETVNDLAERRPAAPDAPKRLAHLPIQEPQPCFDPNDLTI